MIRWLPLFGLLFTSTAFGGDPQNWAGVRLDDPAALGLSKVVLMVGDDAWQGALDDRAGFVRVWVSPDVDSARALFAFQRQYSSTLALPDLAHPGFDEAAGDGTNIAIARIGNVVILARDHAEHATARVDLVAKGLVRQAPAAPSTVDRGGVSRDSVGRQIK
jgi:hypothetical protein